MNTTTRVLVCIAAVLLAGAAAVAAGSLPGHAAHGNEGAGKAHQQPPALFTEAVTQYERVRLALVADDLDAAREPARRLAGVVRAWMQDHNGESEMPARVMAIKSAAEKLADSRTLGDAREAFWALSQPMIAWKKKVGGDTPAIAYCPMVKRKWLQQLGSIGNPFAGGHMAGCGEFVNE